MWLFPLGVHPNDGTFFKVSIESFVRSEICCLATLLCERLWVIGLLPLWSVWYDVRCSNALDMWRHRNMSLWPSYPSDFWSVIAEIILIKESSIQQGKTKTINVTIYRWATVRGRWRHRPITRSVTKRKENVRGKYDIGPSSRYYVTDTHIR